MVPQWFREQLGQKEEPVSSSLQQLSARMNATAAFARDNNEFAIAMYELLRQQRGNLFFSPFSIRTALAMTEAGARGETAAQMKQALRLSPPASHDGFTEALARLSAGDSSYDLSVANSLWSQDGAVLNPEYVALIAQQYGGTLTPVDFFRSTEVARGAINRWVEDKTRHKIRDLIPPGGVTADTRLVLVNAIYFKGMWILQFDEERTHEQPFYLEGGDSVQARLMYQQDDIRYAHEEEVQVVELPYQGDEISMLVFLPDRKDGLADLERKLSASFITRCASHVRSREVILLLPRFKITWGTVDLTDQLRALGMELPFTRAADFSGINGQMPPSEDALFVSAVFHKAFAEVNEEGTEAAAATAVIMRPMSTPFPQEPPPIPVFRADHPFLIAIWDRKSSAILFLGRIMDPTRES